MFSKLCHVMIIALIGYRDTPLNYKKTGIYILQGFPRVRLISNTAVYSHVQRHLSIIPICITKSSAVLICVLAFSFTTLQIFTL